MFDGLLAVSPDRLDNVACPRPLTCSISGRRIEPSAPRQMGRQGASAGEGWSAMRLRLYCLRALLLRCPSCGHATIARRLLAIHDQCRECGLFFIHDYGFWQGAWHFNYFLGSLVAIIPAIVFVATGVWSGVTAMLFGGAVSILFPILFYWHAHSFWIATFYYFVPDDLRMGRDPPRGQGTVRDESLLNDEERQQLWAREGALELEGDRRGRFR